MRGCMPSFIVTVQVIPALTNTPSGTCVKRMRTGMRCASLTQVNVGFTEESSSGASRLSWSVMPLAMPMTVPCSAGVALGTQLGLVRPATNRVEKARRVGDA
jgi:hypothetical protein